MTNVYLEKIAFLREIEPGISQEDGGRNFHVSDEARDRIIEKELASRFKSQKVLGAKVTGGMGAVLGGVVGTSPFFGSGFKRRALNSLIGAAIGGGIGAISGVGLAGAGNNQTREYERTSLNAVKSYLYKNYDYSDNEYSYPIVTGKQD